MAVKMGVAKNFERQADRDAGYCAGTGIQLKQAGYFSELEINSAARSGSVSS